MTDHRHSRREFVTRAGTGIAGVVGVPWPDKVGAAEPQATNPGAENADLVVFNARVYTVDSRVPKAEAFAVKAGRFVAVGSARCAS
jgi:hypothetical protein